MSAVQGRLTQLEQRQQMTGSGGNVGGQVMVAQYGTVNDMAGEQQHNLFVVKNYTTIIDMLMMETAICDQ